MGEWVDRNTQNGLLHETLGLAYVEQKKKKKKVLITPSSLSVGCAIKNYRYLKVKKIHIFYSLHDLLDLMPSALISHPFFLAVQGKINPLGHFYYGMLQVSY